MSFFSSIGSALSGGVGSLLGSAVGAVGSFLGGQQANSAAKSIQQGQEQYNTSMADTNYQRTMADLKAAGLNPLMAIGGSLDTVPGAPSAPVINSIGDAVHSAQQGYTLDAQLKNTQAQTEVAKAQVDKVSNDALVSGYSATQQGMMAPAWHAQSEALKAQADADKAEADVKRRLFTEHPDMMISGDLIHNFFGPATSSASDVFNMFKKPRGIYVQR